MNPMPIAPADIRVALFSGNYNYCVDGVTLVLNRLVEHLLSRGVKVRVFAPTAKVPAMKHAGKLTSVPSVPFPLNTSYRLAWGIPARVQKQIDKFDPNIVHIASPEGLGFAALRMARRKRIPAVTTYHTHFGSYLPYFGLGFLEPFLWKLARRFYNRTRETYVPSTSMRELLRSKGIICPMKVWEHGVDVDKFNPAKRSLEWRRAHGVQDHEFLVGFVGRLVWEKAIGVFADMVERLQSSGRPLRFAMIGSGLAFPAMQARLKNAILPGYMPHDTLAAAFASLDAFVNPSLSETFGCVTLEAMASGVPAIAADATGSRDIITHGVDGFLCEPNNVDDFAKRVLQLVDDVAMRESIRAAGLRHASNSTWERVLDHMIEHYIEIVSDDGGAK